ncbi:hypothetical protein HDE_05056 [Halotydeus destructor]|nr:hypothetical protein HDE_05056 [Halotydeus destructor]
MSFAEKKEEVQTIQVVQAEPVIIREEPHHHRVHHDRVVERVVERRPSTVERIVERRPVETVLVSQESRPLHSTVYQVQESRPAQIKIQRPSQQVIQVVQQPAPSSSFLASMPSFPSIPHPKDWFKKKEQPPVVIQQPVVVEKTRYVETHRRQPAAHKRPEPCCQF